MPLSENIVIRKKFSVLEMIWENRKSNMECIFIYYFTSTLRYSKHLHNQHLNFPQIQSNLFIGSKKISTKTHWLQKHIIIINYGIILICFMLIWIHWNLPSFDWIFSKCQDSLPNRKNIILGDGLYNIVNLSKDL